MSGNPECHEAHKLIAKIANPLVAYAPVAMTDDYALRASRSIIGTQPSLINQLNVPMMSPMYSSRAQPELSEGFPTKNSRNLFSINTFNRLQLSKMWIPVIFNSEV